MCSLAFIHPAIAASQLPPTSNIFAVGTLHCTVFSGNGRSLFGLRDFSIAGDFLEMGFCVARSLFGPRDFALQASFLKCGLVLESFCLVLGFCLFLKWGCCIGRDFALNGFLLKWGLCQSCKPCTGAAMCIHIYVTHLTKPVRPFDSYNLI